MIYLLSRYNRPHVTTGMAVVGIGDRVETDNRPEFFKRSRGVDSVACW